MGTEIGIGVYGSATAEREDAIEGARIIGRELALAGCTVITGACSGLPYLAAEAAARHGGRVHGFSPTHDIEEQRAFTPEDDLSVYSRLEFLPRAEPFLGELVVRKKYRNVRSTAACDGAILIQGRWGTLHEATSLVDFGAVIGVLEGTGEIADLFTELASRLGLDGGALLIRSSSPEELVRLVTERVRARRAAAGRA